MSETSTQTEGAKDTKGPGRTKRPVGGAPRMRNEFFTGRTALIARIRKALSSERRVVLTDAGGSVGGLGKTEVAKQYAYQFAGDYRATLYVRAERTAVLAARYAPFAVELALPEGASDDQAEKIDAVRSWLEQNNGWLMILDDIEDPEALRRFVPNGSTGHVLIASNRLSETDTYSAFPVGPFEPDEAAEFLLRRSHRSQDQGAHALAECLGRVPLALDLAGAYAEAMGTPFQDCVDLVRETLAQSEGLPLEELHTTRMVHAILRLSLKQIVVDCPPAMDLLAVSAFLAPERISLGMLRDERSSLSKRLSSAISDEGAAGALVDVLQRYGLVQRSDEAISMHTVVQKAIRAGLDETASEAWGNAAVNVIAHAFPADEHYDHALPACSRLLGHAFAVIGHAELYGVAPKRAEALLNQVGLYLHGCKEWEEAKRCFRHAITLSTTLYGENDSRVAARFNSLGVSFQDQGKLAKARDCFQRAIAISEALHGPDHEVLAMPVRNLGMVLRDLGEFEEAVKIHAKALGIYEKMWKTDYHLVAECVNSLGGIWRSLGKLRKARQCFGKAVLYEENSRRREKGNLGKYLSNFGKVLVEINEIALAGVQFERALEVDRADLGASHSVVGRHLINLGQVLTSKGQFSQAQTCFERALTIRSANDGPNSSEVSRVLKLLGRVLCEPKATSRAKACLKRALEIDEAAYGPEAPEVAKSLIDLAQVLQDLGDFSGAKVYLERTLSLEEQVNGTGHERVAMVLGLLGSVNRALGQSDEAVDNLKRALAIHTRVHGMDHPEVARSAYLVGRAQAEVGDTVVALGHLGLALGIYEKSFGSAHPDTRRVRRKLTELGYTKTWLAGE